MIFPAAANSSRGRAARVWFEQRVELRGYDLRDHGGVCAFADLWRVERLERVMEARRLRELAVKAARLPVLRPAAVQT